MAEGIHISKKSQMVNRPSYVMTNMFQTRLEPSQKTVFHAVIHPQRVASQYAHVTDQFTRDTCAVFLLHVNMSQFRLCHEQCHPHNKIALISTARAKSQQLAPNLNSSRQISTARA